MPIRQTVQPLINRLRRMLGDAAGPDQTWSDDDLQDFLDETRCEARYRRLHEIETITPGGSVEYRIFEAGIGDWETGALVDGSFASVTADTIDLLRGRWEFASAPNRPIYITGYFFDLAAAAVEVVDAWIAKWKCQTDYSVSSDLSDRRSQKVEHLLELRAQLVKRMRVGSGQMTGETYVGM